MKYNSQTTTDKQVLRKSNIEILRIVAMVMIIAHHYAYHGRFEFPGSGVSINQLWIKLIMSGGKIGVGVFVLISGYFLISTKQIRINKVIKIWGQLLFYSVFLFIVFVLAGMESFGIKKLFFCFVPVMHNTWWFASTYFFLYLFSPFINISLCSLDKKQYICLLSLMVFYCCIIPSFNGRLFNIHSLFWFVILYSLGGYLKLFGMSRKLIVYAFGTLLFVISLIFVCSSTSKILSPDFKEPFIQNMKGLRILIISFLLLIGFSKINIGCNKLINIVASATFGVYLIHEHPLVRPFLWRTLFKNASYSESNMLILHSLLVVFIVFLCCTLIELLRINIIEKKYISVVNKTADIIPRLLTKKK